tara:strand:+ start:2122 stop:2541 length:420 start_codon:yes stop_codon:yes gene_type:complete
MLFSLKILSLLVQKIEIGIHVHHNSFVVHEVLQKSNRLKRGPISDKSAHDRLEKHSRLIVKDTTQGKVLPSVVRPLVFMSHFESGVLSSRTETLVFLRVLVVVQRIVFQGVTLAARRFQIEYQVFHVEPKLAERFLYEH